MLRRLRAWLTRPKGKEARVAAEERSSGEDALETADRAAAEATPSGMPRVKTDRL